MARRKNVIKRYSLSIIAEVFSGLFDPRVEIPTLLVLAVLTAYRDGAALLFLSMLFVRCFTKKAHGLKWYLVLNIQRLLLMACQAVKSSS